MDQTSLFIFRKDLRLEDNTALHYLCQKSSKICFLLLVDFNDFKAYPATLLNTIYKYYAMQNLNISISCLVYEHFSDMESKLTTIINKHNISLLAINKEFDIRSINEENVILKLCKVKSLDLIMTQDKSVWESVFVDNLFIKNTRSGIDYYSIIRNQNLLPLETLHFYPSYFLIDIKRYLHSNDLSQISYDVDISKKTIIDNKINDIAVYEKKIIKALETLTETSQVEFDSCVDILNKLDYKGRKEVPQNKVFEDSVTKFSVKGFGKSTSKLQSFLFNDYAAIIKKEKKATTLKGIALNPYSMIKRLLEDIKKQEFDFNGYSSTSKMDDFVNKIDSLLLWFQELGFISPRKLFRIVDYAVKKFPTNISHKRFQSILLDREFYYHHYVSNYLFMFSNPTRTFLRSIAVTKDTIQWNKSHCKIFFTDSTMIKDFKEEIEDDIRLGNENLSETQYIDTEEIVYDENYIINEKTKLDTEIELLKKQWKEMMRIIKRLEKIGSSLLLKRFELDYNYLLFEDKYKIDVNNPNIQNVRNVVELVDQINKEYNYVNFNKNVHRIFTTCINNINSKIMGLAMELENLLDIGKEIKSSNVKKGLKMNSIFDKKFDEIMTSVNKITEHTKLQKYKNIVEKDQIDNYIKAEETFKKLPNTNVMTLATLKNNVAKNEVAKKVVIKTPSEVGSVKTKATDKVTSKGLTKPIIKKPTDKYDGKLDSSKSITVVSKEDHSEYPEGFSMTKAHIFNDSTIESKITYTKAIDSFCEYRLRHFYNKFKLTTSVNQVSELMLEQHNQVLGEGIKNSFIGFSKLLSVVYDKETRDKTKKAELEDEIYSSDITVLLKFLFLFNSLNGVGLNCLITGLKNHYELKFKMIKPIIERFDIAFNFMEFIYYYQFDSLSISKNKVSSKIFGGDLIEKLR
ncbi:putative deoxyribodipyrimidine photo-lyase [Carp edema virus]|nr:putative deoxyribodipyrimidine photo-lyase [Carp edema virus]